jgi:hypothetical protein
VPGLGELELGKLVFDEPGLNKVGRDPMGPRPFFFLCTKEGYA